jgi:purine-binding chemotaxis protein CheW
MKSASQAAVAGGSREDRESLVVRLRALEGEIQRTQAALAAMGGETLPGLHLAVEVAGRTALLAVARVQEIVRLVAMQPLPGAPAQVLGTFVCRGLPVVAVDLGAVVTGSAREPALDAQVIVLAGAQTLGLVVDRIGGLVDGPRLFEGDAAGAVPEGWVGSRLVAGLCVHDGAVLPLLDPSPLAAAAREWTA